METGPRPQYATEVGGRAFGLEGAGGPRGKPARRSLLQMAMGAFGGGYRAASWTEEACRDAVPTDAGSPHSFKNLRTNPLAAPVPGHAGANPGLDLPSFTCLACRRTSC